MVIFLGTEKLEEITENSPARKTPPAAVVYHAHGTDQKIVRGTVADIAAKAREARSTHCPASGGWGCRHKKEGHVASLLLFMTRTVVVAPGRFPSGMPGG